MESQEKPSKPITDGTVVSSIDPYMEELTAILDEIDLYDRQIRLWGVQAQEK